MSQVTALDPWETPRPDLQTTGGLAGWRYPYLLGWCALHQLDPAKTFNARDLTPIIEQTYGEHVDPRTSAGLLKKLERRGYIERIRVSSPGRTQYVYHLTPLFTSFTRRNPN